MTSKLSLIDRISVQLAERAAAEEQMAKSATSVSQTPIVTQTAEATPASTVLLPKAEDSNITTTTALHLLLNSHFPLNPASATVPGKRPASPEETQHKRARLSPESSLSIKTEIEDSFSIATETEDSILSLSALSTAEPSPVLPLRDDTIFCQVPGRLALLNNNSKYPVPISEIRRRLGNPERLNASILGGVLRRAKSKNGGKELRDQLEQIGLDLPAGKRKAFHMTLFTAMVEGEAMHLAKDFDFLCETEFPTDILADHQLQQEREERERKKRDLEGTIRVLSNLVSTLQQDRSPVFMNTPTPVLPENVQEALTHFSLCTHGFGTPAIVAVINTMMRYAEKSLSKLNCADQAMKMENNPLNPLSLNPLDLQSVWKYVLDLNNLKAAAATGTNK